MDNQHQFSWAEGNHLKIVGCKVQNSDVGWNFYLYNLTSNRAETQDLWACAQQPWPCSSASRSGKPPCGAKAFNFQVLRDFYRFLRLPWETSTFKNYHPEDSGHSGSGRIEFSSKSTTFLM